MRLTARPVLSGDFHGGVELVQFPWPARGPIVKLALPRVLHVPLQQGRQPPGQLVVSVGETVSEGQMLARAPAGGAALHSPAAGIIAQLDEGPVCHPSGLPGARLEIHTLEPACELPMFGSSPVPCDPSLPASWDRAWLRLLVADAGIIGMGGAGFAAAGKFAGPAIQTVIANAVECEPGISCDLALLRAHSESVLDGLRIVQHATRAPRALIAVKSDAPVRATLSAALADRDMELLIVPNRYPAGAERQLFECATGTSLPAGVRPSARGLVVLNVATLAAISAAARQGQPLTRRIVSVAGDGVTAPGHFDVAIGTPIAELLAAAGVLRDEPIELRVGGARMGYSISDPAAPVSKDCNAVLVSKREAKAPARPCIRCGECVPVCPERLQPDRLHALLQQGKLETAASSGLSACTECGACDAVCPSVIPLAAQFSVARVQHATRANQAAQARAARQRYETRRQRLVDRASERDAQALRRRPIPLSTSATPEPGSADPAALARAALARSRQRANRSQPRSADGGPDEPA